MARAFANRLRKSFLIGVVVLMVAAMLVPRTALAASSGPDECSADVTLNVVAHEDDDLLFQGATIAADIAAGHCVRTVYVTAGNDNLPSWYWLAREAGVKAAYAELAGVSNNWASADTGIPGHPIMLATLVGAPAISLAFMHLPDGQMDGSGDTQANGDSLQKLMQGVIHSIHTVDGSPAYTKDALVDTLATIMDDFRPTSINTLDYSGAYGDGDHSDHHVVAQLTKLAQAQYRGVHSFNGYLGYGIATYPANLSGAAVSTKSNAFFTYGSFDYKTCDSAPSCANRAEGAWLHREYLVDTGQPVVVPPDLPPIAPGTNVAEFTAVTASSENHANNQLAANAVDGVADGYPGDYTREWATNGGGVGSWLDLAWATPVSLDKIVLFDRPNLDDHVLAGSITFSDGSTVAVPELSNEGAATTITFPARDTTSIRFTITAVSTTTHNIGLAELQAWGPAST
ncbi:MAG: PIG-L family deacetylase [Nakamurella sp.]